MSDAARTATEATIVSPATLSETSRSASARAKRSEVMASLNWPIDAAAVAQIEWIQSMSAVSPITDKAREDCSKASRGRPT